MEVRLRPVQVADLPFYHRWQEEDPHWERYTCRPVELVRPYPAFRAHYVRALAEARELVFSVIADDRPVGRMVAFDENPRNRSMEIGYYFAAESRGQGVGRKALRMFVGILFAWPGKELHKLYATTSAENGASIAILERVGFHLDGRLREHYLIDGRFSDQLFYSLLRREWSPGEDTGTG